MNYRSRNGKMVIESRDWPIASLTNQRANQKNGGTKVNVFGRKSLALRCIAVALLFCLMAPPEGSAQTALSQTYIRVKQSLALIIYQDEKYQYSGTAFCVGSSDTTSYFLTNAHVVAEQREVSVVLPNEPGPAHRGTVLRVNTDIDLALVSIAVPHLPSLSIADDVLPEGQPIAIAGYPATHMAFMRAGQGLLPSVHEGMVNSYPNDGSFLEFDAQVEHGNSGGPVFDPQTGIVYGVERLKVGDDQTNLAIPVSRVTGFLTNAGVAYTHGRQTAAAAQPPAQPQTAPQPQTPTTARQSDSSTTRRFATYVPLQNRKQIYACSHDMSFTVFTRGVSATNYKVTYTLKSPGAAASSTSSLRTHDGDNNLVVLGDYTDAGTITWLSQPYVKTPLWPGTKVERNDKTNRIPDGWVGSVDMPLPGTTYATEVYSMTAADGGYDLEFYADHVGMVALAMYSKNGQKQYVCGLVSSVDTP